jgi:hypothetical protein
MIIETWRKDEIWREDKHRELRKDDGKLGG